MRSVFADVPPTNAQSVPFPEGAGAGDSLFAAILVSPKAARWVGYAHVGGPSSERWTHAGDHVRNDESVIAFFTTVFRGTPGAITAHAVGILHAIAYYATPGEVDILSDPSHDPDAKEAIARIVVSRRNLS